jgi:phosphorylase kinase alpha/beta subunit
MNQNANSDPLEPYFQQVQGIILNRQHWISGLLPASTAVNAHGNYTDAWVRDNVYSILPVWGLGLAYQKRDDTQGRRYVLEQSTVKLMRGLLMAMMRQSPKVEKFKHTQNPLDALHAKYDTKTGAAVVGDHEWGHLQLDATSLFLLMLAQMTASGLRIVFTVDEVNFVQNLVHYISRTYRTPDYGIWERGNKINHGIAELNASSIGMAKAALEALSGFNLFGKDGGQASVIHVISDDIARTRITLEALLPRESLSKEVDSALLSITGFPAFAVENPAIREKTERLIREKLQGRYGCKRFLLDGHQTVIEDNKRPYYNAQELKRFMDIECEWPLFFGYFLLNHLFAGDTGAAADYRTQLEGLLVEQNGQKLLPELYIVPEAALAAEKARPHSQTRVANENVPLVWAQSLFVLGTLIQDGLLSTDDIDPLGRHKMTGQGGGCTLQIALLAQDENVQADLRDCGIAAQTLAEVAPLQIRDASELAAAYTHVGRNDRYGLTGRPLRQLRALSTSKLYVLSGERLLFLPQFLDQKGFYLAMDNRLLIQRLRVELAYIYRHWDCAGHPLMVVSIKQNMLETHNRAELIAFIKALQSGSVNNVPVTLGFAGEFMATVSREQINYLHDFQFSEAAWQESARPFFQALPFSEHTAAPLDTLFLAALEIGDDEHLLEQLNANHNLYVQLEVLSQLGLRHGLDYVLKLTGTADDGCPVRDLLEEVYQRAGNQHAWYIIRRCAGLLGKYDINLEQAATDILVRQKLLTVGRAYSGRATLTRPSDSSEILQIIRTYNNNDASELIIVQELIIYLGMLIKSTPELFADMHTVRVGHILQLILVRQKRQRGGTLDQAFNAILFLSPYQLLQLVEATLADYSNTESQLSQVETLSYEGRVDGLGRIRFSTAMDGDAHAGATDWYDWRERQGSVGRENDAFFASVWRILHHCQGLMVGEKLNSKRRLDSETILSQMTSGEQSFKRHVSHLLNKIQAPVYRQLTAEAILAIAAIFQDNALIIEDTLVTDVIIGHAVRLCWLQAHPQHQDHYEEQVSLAWQAFYQLPPHRVANGILDALVHLLNNDKQPTPKATA